MNSTRQIRAQENRGTLFVESGELVSTEAYPGRQFVMRIRAPKCAAAARPGSFVHVSCDDALPMRRPLSIMRVADDCIEVLYKIVGEGLHLLAHKRPGDKISVLGPIGQPFLPSAERPTCLLIGGGVGIPPMVFLAESLQDEAWNSLAILGSELPFPFQLQESALATPWLDTEVNRTISLFENIGTAARLASLSDFSGCFRGYVTELAELWLQNLDAADKAQVEIFSCGPTPMLKAVAALATRHNIPCQVSLEEFMACAVGGCAGCCVEISTADGPAMKRVCVDGPVFNASNVIWS